MTEHHSRTSEAPWILRKLSEFARHPLFKDLLVVPLVLPTLFVVRMFQAFYVAGCLPAVLLLRWGMFRWRRRAAHQMLGSEGFDDAQEISDVDAVLTDGLMPMRGKRSTKCFSGTFSGERILALTPRLTAPRSALKRNIADTLLFGFYEEDTQPVSGLRLVLDAREWLSHELEVGLAHYAWDLVSHPWKDLQAIEYALIDDKTQSSLGAKPTGLSLECTAAAVRQLQIVGGRIVWTDVELTPIAVRRGIEALLHTARRLQRTAHLGRPAEVIALLSEKVAHDPNSEIRSESLRMLAEYLGDEIERTDTLAIALNDRHPLVQIVALNLSPEERFDDVAAIILGDDVASKVRTDAIIHLVDRYGFERHQSTRVAEVLRRCLSRTRTEDTDGRRIEEAAIRGLVRLRYAPSQRWTAWLDRVVKVVAEAAEVGDRDAIDILSRLVDDENWGASESAVAALAKVGTLEELPFLEHLRREPRNREKSKRAAIDAAIATIRTRAGHESGQLSLTELETAPGRVSISNDETD